MRAKLLPFILLASISTLILSGCSTTQSSALSEVPTIDLHKGSPVADLIELWGEPDSIEPLERAPEVSVWTYKKQRSVTELIGAESVEIPYIHPITGEEMTLEEPVFKPQTTTSTQIIKVFVVDEKILAWRVDSDSEQRMIE
ncbi:hypothetical protein [Pelagicoccus sp. SDUM812003]|uniref:hypothetical protein n=1 Tax=Pelagicoccus sp. SDUM812003 TaxID=3041267 RepID=UPI00280FD725|nr:hypothetical protein [Pelagicoccus sp. SDUM812003]MDQ8203895.1 hypothetical protein [Pelagicoccus sp. SDUM812003]